MNTSEQTLDDIFQALSDSTRRSILMQVREEEQTVSDIASSYAMSMPAITKHLNILERAGLLVRIKDGRKRLCRAEPRTIQSAVDWLEHYQQFWNMQLDSLKEFVENHSASNNGRKENDCD